MLDSLYYDWFHNKSYWFSQNYDYYISQSYFHLLDSYIYPSNKIDYIALIILFDQIPRHFFRNTLSNHILTYYSYKASLISRKILNKYQFNDDELLFIYLPFRHIFDFSMIDSIISIYIKKYLESSNQFYKKIINATVSKSIYMRNRFIIHNQYHDYNLFFHPILEYNPITPLKKQYNTSLFHTISSKYIHDYPIIVSLSGGVDSNVLLYLCSFLNIKVIAIHINYNNRSSCDKEEDFLKYYCNLLNIPLYIRKITELNRNICHKNGLRDLYESLTKQIRFQMYSQLQEIYGTCYVALGHNLDDCFENIITNISKNQKYDNLHGMETFSIIDNINFFRPFLDIPKSDIIKCAIQHSIPYLEDSTPSWSARGKIRDHIKPCLEEFHLTKSFYDLSNQLSSIMNVVHNIIIPLCDNIIPEDEYIWKKIFHNKGIQVSNKCMKEFMIFIQNSMKNNRKFVLNKNYTFQILPSS
tara:strand:+ start:15996 stop:17405 length:1410 start_codon:yes stop_codon:yes gene_type:complete